MANKPLTPKQRRFVEEYIVDLNATNAAIRAGYGVKGARVAGCRLLTYDNVSAALAKFKAKSAKQAQITIHSLAQELEEARAIAVAEKQSSAAVSATMGKAKLFGFGVEKRHITGTMQVITITSQQLAALTSDELAALEHAYPILQKLGLVATDDPSGETGAGSEQAD